MNPKQKLNRLLAESGAVVPHDKVHKLPEALGVTPPTPFEVVKTFRFDKRWDVRAVDRMASFFDQRGQLRERYRANECFHLVVAFKGPEQAEAFEIACQGRVFTRN